MSEKRFTSYYERGNEVVIEDNGKRLSNKKVVDLLNELTTKCSRLKKENEQLKQEIIVYKKAFQEQVQRCSL